MDITTRINGTAGAIGTLSMLRYQRQEDAVRAREAQRSAAGDEERAALRRIERRAAAGWGIIESAILGLTWELLTLGDKDAEKVLSALKADTRKILNCS